MGSNKLCPQHSANITTVIIMGLFQQSLVNDKHKEDKPVLHCTFKHRSLEGYNESGLQFFCIAVLPDYTEWLRSGYNRKNFPDCP